jgi:cell division protein FtsA
MANKNIVTGIDIGNSTIKTIIAEFKEESGKPQILGIGLSSSNGLRRGVVIDMAEAIEDLRKSVVQAESAAGVRIKKAYASISGPHIKSQISRGVIAVSRADNEISENDIQRVLEAASTISLPPNREIIHRIPKKFIVDGQEFFKNPVGMTGIRLETDVIVIDALTPYIKSLAKVINENGIEVVEFVYSPLASARAVLNKKVREHGAASFDFGGGLCHLAVFEEGELIHTASLPLGSKNITNDLAIAIKTSLDNAEKVKLEYGFVGTNYSKKENLDLSEITDEEDMMVPKKIIGEVISDRVIEIVEMVSNELKKINRLLPGGIVFAGGGAKLTGFAEYIKEKLKLPVKKFSDYEFIGAVNKIDDPSWAGAIGLVLWGIERKLQEVEKGIFENFGSPKNLKKIKNWFRIFLP